MHLLLSFDCMQLLKPARRSTRKANLGREKELPLRPQTAAAAVLKRPSHRRFQGRQANRRGRNTIRIRNDQRKAKTTAGKEVHLWYGLKYRNSFRSHWKTVFKLWMLYWKAVTYLLLPPATGVQYVIHRYKQVLSAFIKKKSMSEAFRHLGIDRNTIANTASIAELHLAGKDMVPLVGTFRQGEETLVSYAQRCTLVIDSDAELARKIDQMKASGELLPISGKRPRGFPPHLQQLAGAAESILIGWWLFNCMEGLKLNSPSQNVHLVCFQSQSKLLDLNILCSLFIFFICELCSRKEKVELFSGFMIMITRLGCAFFLTSLPKKDRLFSVGGGGLFYE